MALLSEGIIQCQKYEANNKNNGHIHNQKCAKNNKYNIMVLIAAQTFGYAVQICFYDQPYCRRKLATQTEL